VNLAEYSSCDAVGLAQLINSGAVSVSDVTSAAFRALDATNGALNAVVERYEEASLAAARTSAPLAGVPSLRKDIHLEAGRATSYASRLAHGYVASTTSTHVRRLEELGLRFIGRSASSEFAMYGTTESRLFGVTRNPWGLERSSGGSSGGAAAAVAAGVVPVADASDAGGSIRIPAACTGLVGFKASRSVAKHARGRDDLNANVHGVLARSVRDVALVAQHLDGICPARPGPLRIAVSLDPWRPRESVDPEIVQAVRDVAEALESPRRVVVEASPFYDVEAFWDAIVTRLTLDLYDEVTEMSRIMKRPATPELLEPATWLYYAAGRDVTGDDVAAACEKRDRVLAHVRAFFTGYDVLITPTLQVRTPSVGTAGGETLAATARDHFLLAEEVSPNLALFNMTGHPALSVPTGHGVDGLPIGVQLVGRDGADATLLSLADELEQRFTWRERLPLVHVTSSSRHDDGVGVSSLSNQ
jgi:amidase